LRRTNKLFRGNSGIDVKQSHAEERSFLGKTLTKR